VLIELEFQSDRACTSGGKIAASGMIQSSRIVEFCGKSRMTPDTWYDLSLSSLNVLPNAFPLPNNWPATVSVITTSDKWRKASLALPSTKGRLNIPKIEESA
jgi:hypothetical protein